MEGGLYPGPGPRDHPGRLGLEGEEEEEEREGFNPGETQRELGRKASCCGYLSAAERVRLSLHRAGKRGSALSDRRPVAGRTGPGRAGSEAGAWSWSWSWSGRGSGALGGPRRGTSFLSPPSVAVPSFGDFS